MSKGALQAAAQQGDYCELWRVVVAGGAHEGRRLWRKQAEVSPVSNESHKRVLRAMWIDDCELWQACSPVHQLVKKTFLTS